MPGKGSSNRGRHGSNLVLGLKRLDAEILVTRQFMKDVAGWGDWIARVEQGTLGHLGRGDESQCRRLVACDVPIFSWRQAGLPHAVVSREEFGGVRIVETGTQSADIGFKDNRVLL